MKTRTKHGLCYGVKFCVQCDKRLGTYHEMYSGGICPHCGHNSNSTICRTKTRVYRVISHQVKVLGLFWFTTKEEIERVP